MTINILGTETAASTDADAEVMHVIINCGWNYNQCFQLSPSFFFWHFDIFSLVGEVKLRFGVLI